MDVLIIEDENLAAERLIKLITNIDKSINIVGSIESVRNVVSWLECHRHPDLIFMDIHLADGLSFQIFEKTTLNVPVIFTTAYNEYALKAFKVNSIDYLLKPIDKDELKNAFDKFLMVRNASISVSSTITKTFPDYSQMMKEMREALKHQFKTRFVIRIGEHIKTILTDDVAFFYSNDKSSFLRTINGRDFAIDCSLEQLENEINPKHFFRVGRKYMVALHHIHDIIAYSGNRLKIITKYNIDEEILVSREKVTEFKKWLEG